MRHQMAVSFVLFFFCLSSHSLAENNLSQETNSSYSSVKKPTPIPTFHTTYWKLITLFEVGIAEEKMPREAYMNFSPLIDKQGEFKGGTGCNDLLGKYNADDANLSFNVKRIAMTRLACPESTIEMDFLKALEETKLWRIEEDTLLFMDTNGSKVASFKAHSKSKKLIGKK